MNIYISVFKKVIKILKWIAIEAKIAAALVFYEALLYDAISFDPHNISDFICAFYKAGNYCANGLLCLWG